MSELEIIHEIDVLYSISLKSGQAILIPKANLASICLLYTSDAADERSSVDLGGRRIIKKKKIVNM